MQRYSLCVCAIIIRKKLKYVFKVFSFSTRVESAYNNNDAHIHSLVFVPSSQFNQQLLVLASNNTGIPDCGGKRVQVLRFLESSTVRVYRIHL